MHTTIIGAGVLGRVYGVRLAQAGAEVSFVVRPSRLAETSPFVIEQVKHGGDRRDVLASPRRVASIDERSNVVIVTLRFDQLDAGSGGDLIELLRRSAPRSAPILVLSPMMPAQRAAIEGATGRRLVAAMPGVAGYLNNQDVVRYWVPTVTSTLLDDLPASAIGEPARVLLESLPRYMTKIGLPTRLERDVARLNAATTTEFFPLVAAIDAGGGVDGVLSDKELLAIVVEAAKESNALAHKLGKPATWAHLLTKFVGPFTLKPGVMLAKRLVPESVHFVEHHFGPKLHDQHIAMGDAILELGREHGTPMPALARLMAVLRAKQGA